MPSYFKLRSNMCQMRTEAKPECTWKEEYFCESESGLCSISVYESGLVYLSPVIPSEKIGTRIFQVPINAVPCSATEYADAYAKYEKAKREREEKEAKAKELADLLKTGKLYSAAPQFLDDFTVLDIEFQGTDMLELAAQRFQGWQLVDTLQSFVRFRGELNFHVSNLTGIGRMDVWEAPEEKQVLRQFKQLAGDSLLVCHNVSADQRVLEAARSRQGAQAALPNMWFCTLALAKHRLPGRKHGLGELCTDFGIATHGAHRALRDVEMCAGLLRHLHQLQPITGPLPTKAKGKKTSPAQSSLFAAA